MKLWPLCGSLPKLRAAAGRKANSFPEFLRPPPSRTISPPSRTPMRLAPDSPLSTCFPNEPKALKALADAGFSSAADIASHFPFRHEDRRHFTPWPSSESPDPQTIRGMVSDSRQLRSGFRKPFVEVTLQPLEGQDLLPPVILRWFNLPWLHKSFAADMEVIAFGKIKAATHGRLVIDHPEYEILSADSDDAAIHIDRITPIYRAPNGIPQKTLRRAAFLVLSAADPDAWPDILPPPSPNSDFSGLSRLTALRDLHFPPSAESMERARRYLALEEFYLLQLHVLRRRLALLALKGTPHCGPGLLLNRWLDSLPFALTSAQLRCLDEIRADLASHSPMHRMLQGDVGSGKTFVAIAAILLAVESGSQAVLMAPTRILASQHALTFHRWLDPLGLRIALLTGARSDDANALSSLSADNPPHIIIGTHALLHGNRLANPGLIVIDEQHKFGVAQRNALAAQSSSPDILVMTATPIPRSLTMTLYGDLDLSTLDEMPAGRKPITTAVRINPDPVQIAAFLRAQFNEGRQAYLVFPLIDESNSLAVRAATREVETWRTRLPDHQLGLLHGRTPADEKDALMDAFRAGSIHALCATSVVEVGVDIPNASVILIFDADRFGLAQLHQLRGRVGRGPHKSFCILVTNGDNSETTARLQLLEQTADGFAVAEADLRIRGPGDLMGTAQSGLPDLRLGDLIRDAPLVRTARRLASATLEADPSLSGPHRHLLPLLAPPPETPSTPA
jgi:ATP-dependent DNA helicase RecG